MNMYDRQVELELLFNKNQLIPRIKAEFVNCTDFDFPAYIKQCGIPEAFGFDLLTQIALHKRTSLTTLIGVLRHHFEDSQLTADMIYLAADCDLLDYDPITKQFIVIFEISEDVQEELEKFQYPLPMIVEPLPVVSNKQTGYITSKGSIILRHNHTDNDVCLDHINRMNRVKFTINNNTASMVRNTWKNLDKPKEGETKDEFTRRKRAFEKYNRTAKEVMGMMPETFYLTHKYDKRGRIYCQGLTH